MTFNTYGLYVGLTQALGQYFQVVLGFGTQYVFVETEQGFGRQRNGFVNILRSLLYNSNRSRFNCIATLYATLGCFVEVSVFPAFAVVVAYDFL